LRYGYICTLSANEPLTAVFLVQTYSRSQSVEDMPNVDATIIDLTGDTTDEDGGVIHNNSELKFVDNDAVVKHSSMYIDLT
jgi:hypothetical protein